MSAFTKEFVMDLAEKAGLEPKLWNHTDAFERFFELAVAAEREACAKVCEELLGWNEDDPGSSASNAIRARGQE